MTRLTILKSTFLTVAYLWNHNEISCKFMLSTIFIKYVDDTFQYKVLDQKAIFFALHV